MKIDRVGDLPLDVAFGDPLLPKDLLERAVHERELLSGLLLRLLDFAEGGVHLEAGSVEPLKGFVGGAAMVQRRARGRLNGGGGSGRAGVVEVRRRAICPLGGPA